VRQDSFFGTLEARARSAQSLLCVGLDPHPESLPEPSAGAAEVFCRTLLEATADLACAFKVNSAFFELYGAAGWEALGRVVAGVPAEVPVVLDAKRGDIASSSRAYAQAAFRALGATAITVNPYLGREALEPFFEDPARGAFVLCRSSNPGAAEFQDLALAGGDPLYLRVARAVASWNERDNLGLVVGATDAQALARVREAVPGLWFLAPGIGAQGGDLEEALRSGLRPDGLGLLVAISRGIASAPSPRAAAEQFRQAIAEVAGSASGRAQGVIGPHRAIADALFDAGCVRVGEFTLKSGESSPIYFDLRLLAGKPDLLARVAAAYLPLLAGLSFDRLAAVPYAGLPIATAIALQTGRPLLYPRREVKAYGTRAAVEGEHRPGEVAVLIDDLVTTGSSKFEAIDRLRQAGLSVHDVVVLIDRQAGAERQLRERGVRLHAVFRLHELLDAWSTSGRMSAAQADRVRAGLELEVS
jgi:uridine monophosphate synthetase